MSMSMSIHMLYGLVFPLPPFSLCRPHDVCSSCSEAVDGSCTGRRYLLRGNHPPITFVAIVQSAINMKHHVCRGCVVISTREGSGEDRQTLFKRFCGLSVRGTNLVTSHSATRTADTSSPLVPSAADGKISPRECDVNLRYIFSCAAPKYL